MVEYFKQHLGTTSQFLATLEEDNLQNVLFHFWFRSLGTFALKCCHLPLHQPVLPPWAGVQVHTDRAGPRRQVSG